MLVIGDVHGKVKQYLDRVGTADSSFQLGDMGLGFKGVNLPVMDKAHKFIRGNHDNPAVCKEHPNYAGEYGYVPEHQLFYLGGAWSIDQAYRTEGISWWRDEEQSYAELQKALEVYEECKPKVVLTHDCPEKIGELVVSNGPGFFLIGGDGKPQLAGKITTRTGQALQQMWEKHQPELWIFGHYHIPFNMVIGGTRFMCLNELETYTI